MGRDAAVEEVQLRNRFLTEKLEDLEQQLALRAQQPAQVRCEPHSVSRLIPAEFRFQLQLCAVIAARAKLCDQGMPWCVGCFVSLE